VIECDQRVKDAEIFLPLSFNKKQKGNKKRTRILILLCDNTNVNKMSVCSRDYKLNEIDHKLFSNVYIRTYMLF